MRPANRDGFTVRVLCGGSTVSAGLGFVVGERHIVTCSHVVNVALGRGAREQSMPGADERVYIDFPILGDNEGAPVRKCRVQVWVPPPRSGHSGGDVAGLILLGEGMPDGAGNARLLDSVSALDTAIDIFGFPGNPPRRSNGAWVRLRLRSAVIGGNVQLDIDSQSAVRTQPGYSGSPVTITDGVGDAVIGILAVASNDMDSRDSYAIPTSKLVEAWPDLLGNLTIPRCPYRGLRPFTTEDAATGIFVGRDDEVRQLRQMVDRQTMVIVTGSSGVGKSSLINAGLIGALRREEWVTASFRPGSMPFDALAKVIFEIERPEEMPNLDDLIRWSNRLRSEGLAKLGPQLALLRGHPILLHIDPLEEVLDPHRVPLDVREEFLELILSAGSITCDGFRLVCTLRADFLSHLLDHPNTGTRLQDRLFFLSPMASKQLERVIEDPAATCNVRHEEGLVQQIAHEASSGSGLPLLEFALTELWPHQKERLITFSVYYSFGGVTGALSRYAEQMFAELVRRFPEERIRRVMLAMVRSRGGHDEAIRRLVSRGHLGEDWAIAEEMAARRLLVLGRDTVAEEDIAELAHEALIQAWPRFASWVDDDADFQHWLSTMEERAAEGDLLSDARIAEAERWMADRLADIPDDVKQLVEESRSEWHRRMSELEEARNQAQNAARQAEARRLAAAAELALASRGVAWQVPIALGIESLQLAPTVEGDIATRHAIRATPIRRAHFVHDAGVRAVAFSPDGSTGGHRQRRRQRPGLRRRHRQRAMPPRSRGQRLDRGVQPGRISRGHRQRRRQRPDIRRNHRRSAGPARTQRPRAGGGVQPGRVTGGHRQRRRQRPGLRRNAPAASYAA